MKEYNLISDKSSINLWHLVLQLNGKTYRSNLEIWLPRPKSPTGEEIAQATLEQVEQIEEFKGRTAE
jgi:hypothetical protein